MEKTKVETQKLNFWETNHIHSYPWYQVAAGYWWRYPNQHSSHVFSVDTMESKIQEDGQLYTRRLIIKTNPLPSWGKHFFPARRVAVIEESIVDPKGHKLIWYTRNIGLDKFMSTVEKATLTRSPTNDQSETDVLKQVWIGSSIIGFRSAIRKFGTDRYKKNCVLATEGFETVLTNAFGPSNNESHAENTKSSESEKISQINMSEFCPVTKNPGQQQNFGGKKSADPSFGGGGGENKRADISLSKFVLRDEQKITL